MISITGLSKGYGERVLFDRVSLSINPSERIGLIGPNGAGKSTLFSIILKKTEASSGSIVINKGVRIGYLPQEASFKSRTSVLEEVTKGDEHIFGLSKEKKALEETDKAGTHRYGQVMQELEFLGFFGLEHKAKKILSGLGFKESDFSRKVGELSGGWQMRILLAKLLVYRYDILFLDEPMNHLDLEAAIWFKNYLLNYKGTFVMISHDKDFLTEVTNYTLVLEAGRIEKIKGNYDGYREVFSQRRNALLRQFNEDQKKRKQLRDFISRFHAQPNKASQVRSKKRQLERMPEIIVPADRQESIRKFNFPRTKKSGYRVMRLDDLTKSYGDLKVYQGLDFEVTKGEKAVLIGSNGAGKSTLLKILAGVIDIDKGRRIPGHNVSIGYFSQRRMDVLDSRKSILDEAYSAAPGKITIEDVRTILGAFLFSGDDIEKKVSVLSGGEKSRLILAKLLIEPPNFLLLDEPTTHLDVDAVEALIKALKEYEGTMVFISHDIHFVRSIANSVFQVKAGQIRKFSGGFDYYWEKQAEEAVPVKESRPQVKNTLWHKTSKEMKRLQYDERKRIKKHNEALAKKIKSLRQKEEQLELERNVKARVLSNPRSHHNKDMIIKYGQQLKDIEEQLRAIASEINKLKDSFV